MFMRFLTDEMVAIRYAKAGANFGDAVSYIYLGECIGFEDMLKRWAKWEREYARCGYRTISLDRFIKHGGYDESLVGLGVKRGSSEKPTFYAEIYRKVFFGKMSPQIDVSKPGPQAGTCFVPNIREIRETD